MDTLTEAIADLRKAVEINPKNLIATYRLAEEIERQGDPNSDAEFQKLMQQIVRAQPDNLAALLELSRVAAKRGDSAVLKQSVASIRAQSPGWPPEVQAQLAALEVAAVGPDPHAAAMRTTFLRNALMRLPDFRQSMAAIKPPPGDEAQPFTHFLRMETPVFATAPADTAMTFSVAPLANPDKTQWNWIGAISLGDAGAPTVVEANGSEVRLATGARFPFPGGAVKIPPLPEGIVPIDFNYDFKTDLVLAGAGGVRFFRQDKPDVFTDVTAQTKLPKQIVNGAFTGAWAVDIEADGDLDIVMGSCDERPTVLRNNGDTTFTAIYPFTGITGVRGMVWADLNGDGNPDATFIDGSGHLRVFMNQRSGRFTEIPAPAGLGQIKAIAAADASHTGILDLVAVQNDGAVLSLSLKNEGRTWGVTELARVPDASSFLAGEVRLRVADLDNNGAIDLLLARVSPVAGSNVRGRIAMARRYQR